ncbi:hypothetical protein NDU88_006037 [Pleurodeles waltl]|uniref:Uncharacterized protein n=1 Tax=Pleurodeles waltl TaxID=8319 RepID=A0AAV7WEE8_PLEWA|nr:hypothetical protein NDU88_006037 [Pleurodeles waltl]
MQLLTICSSNKKVPEDMRLLGEACGLGLVDHGSPESGRQEQRASKGIAADMWACSPPHWLQVQGTTVSGRGFSGIRREADGAGGRSVSSCQGLSVDMRVPKCFAFAPLFWQKEPITGEVRRPSPMVGEASRMRTRDGALLNSLTCLTSGRGRCGLSTMRQGAGGEESFEYGGGAWKGRKKLMSKMMWHVSESHGPTVVDAESSEYQYGGHIMPLQEAAWLEIMPAGARRLLETMLRSEELMQQWQWHNTEAGRGPMNRYWA